MNQSSSFQVLVTIARRHHLGNSMPATTLLTFTTQPEADLASDRVETKNKLQQEFVYAAIRLY